MQIGLERLLEQSHAFCEGQRLGLVMNQASVDQNLRLACDVIAERYPGQLQCLFSPQHGLWAEQQANMIETQHSTYRPLDVPVYSLYSETRQPTRAMLEDIDCLLIDLQDVGTRVYTFIWTMLECLRACAVTGTRILVLDRPNPIGGLVAEGPMLESAFRSFVGSAEIPLRHGLTIAELAKLLTRELNLNVDLAIISVQGWQRGDAFTLAGRRWVWPSPNMPTLETAQVYPGQVLLEGTNLSEGRGTTRPFEVLGAPFVDEYQWLSALESFTFPGVELRPTRFVPVFDKWQGESCGGIDIHVRDSQAVRSVHLTAALLATVAHLYPHDFAWLEPPYEYECVLSPIDILFGNSHLRRSVDRLRSERVSPELITALTSWDEAAWWHRVAPSLIYQ